MATYNKMRSLSRQSAIQQRAAYLTSCGIPSGIVSLALTADSDLYLPMYIGFVLDNKRRRRVVTVDGQVGELIPKFAAIWTTAVGQIAADCANPGRGCVRIIT